MDYSKAAKAYQQMDLQTKVNAADPHEIITLLMQGAIDRIHQAKNYITLKDIQNKTKAINKTIDIINGLRASLNLESQEEIAGQLEQLYDFMVRHLFSANRENSIPKLEEVEDLIKTIKSGWDQIPLSVRQQFKEQNLESNS